MAREFAQQVSEPRPAVASPRLTRWGPLVAWSTLVLVLTSWPSPHVTDIRNGDTVVHALLYGVLAFAAAVLALGRVDGCHPQFISGRSRDLADRHADSLGALADAAIAAYARRGAAAA